MQTWFICDPSTTTCAETNLTVRGFAPAGSFIELAACVAHCPAPAPAPIRWHVCGSNFECSEQDLPAGQVPPAGSWEDRAACETHCSAPPPPPPIQRFTCDPKAHMCSEEDLSPSHLPAPDSFSNRTACERKCTALRSCPDGYGTSHGTCTLLPEACTNDTACTKTWGSACHQRRSCYDCEALSLTCTWRPSKPPSPHPSGGGTSGDAVMVVVVIAVRLSSTCTCIAHSPRSNCN